MTTYITVAIPYVNAAPHLGYAFELVEADVCARARRLAGERVRFLGGTDDHSLKNVLAAASAGVPVRDFVDGHAARFAALREPLDVSFDDFVRTSTDPRHRPAVERLWSACAAGGDLYQRQYEGSYCVGCEQFYDVAELVDGCCAEHGAAVESVVETNWFFRLSRYQDRLLALIERGDLCIGPEPFRNEVVAFIRSGLQDISVSRSVERARGWGLAVPSDPSQVIYVWFDALTNYISALDYGTGGPLFDAWWRHADRRIHVVGKGIVRFHAVYWPAFLLSAGEPVPTHVHVHPYLTANGIKLSKSSGGGIDPVEIVDRYGTDALRWWCTRDVSATADTDFTQARLVARANDDLANGIANAVNRVTSLADRHRDGRLPEVGAEPLAEAAGLAARVWHALGRFDRRGAVDAVAGAVTALNRHVEATAPWSLAKQVDGATAFDRAIDCYGKTLTAIAEAIKPITPELAARIGNRLAPTDRAASADGAAIFARLLDPSAPGAGRPGVAGPSAAGPTRS